jgi:hypothetical protein
LEALFVLFTPFGAAFGVFGALTSIGFFGANHQRTDRDAYTLGLVGLRVNSAGVASGTVDCVANFVIGNRTLAVVETEATLSGGQDVLTSVGYS